MQTTIPSTNGIAATVFKASISIEPPERKGRSMPLDQSGSQESIGRNVKTEEQAGRPHKQAVAIALDTARKNGARIPAPKRPSVKVKK